MAPAPMLQYERVVKLRQAEVLLKRGRTLIREADAPHAYERALGALNSLGGAIRHAQALADRESRAALEAAVSGSALTALDRARLLLAGIAEPGLEDEPSHHARGGREEEDDLDGWVLIELAPGMYTIHRDENTPRDEIADHDAALAYVVELAENGCPRAHEALRFHVRDDNRLAALALDDRAFDEDD